MSGSSVSKRNGYFRNKGNQNMQMMAINYNNLEMKYGDLEKENKVLKNAVQYWEEKNQINYLHLEEQQKENISAHAKIESLESNKLIIENENRAYRDTEHKKKNSYVDKSIKLLNHFMQIIVTNNPISYSKKLNQLQSQLDKKKYEEDEFQSELRAQQKKSLEHLNIKLESAGTKIGDLNNQVSRLIIDAATRESFIANLQEEMNIKNHELLSYKNQKKKKMENNYPQTNDVLTALKNIEDKYGNVFVTEEAKNKAKKCKFERPLDLLEILDELAKRQKDWTESGQLGKFNPRNGDSLDGLKIDVANNDSKDRMWKYQGEYYKANTHIKIGTTWNHKKTLRIYYDNIDDKLVIFYCGHHP